MSKPCDGDADAVLNSIVFSTVQTQTSNYDVLVTILIVSFHLGFILQEVNCLNMYIQYTYHPEK